MICSSDPMGAENRQVVFSCVISELEEVFTVDEGGAVMVSLAKRIFLQVNLNVKDPKGNSRSCFVSVFS